MREIKFRAWDKKNKKMLKFNEIYPSMYTYDDSLEAMFSNAKDDGLEFMQYTGLKDINGVDIYEKDIVENSLDDEVYEVRFVDGAFRLYSERRIIIPSELFDNSVNNDIELVGNICETPELLEK